MVNKQNQNPATSRVFLFVKPFNMQTNFSLSELKPLAIDAYRHTSFTPEKRGEAMIKDYERLLAADIELIKDATDETKELYKKRFIAHLSHYMSARARIVSPMIAGPANFPVARMEKYRRWEDSAYEKFSTFRDKALKGIQKQIARDKPEDQKQAEVWALIESTIMDKIETIIKIDTGENTYTSRQLIVANLAGFIERMAKNGQADHVKKALEIIRQTNAQHTKPIVTEKHKIFTLVNVAETIEAKQRELSSREAQVYKFEGGEVVLNYEANRLQLRHDVKPAQEVINSLKRNGFKWSPTNKAWQLFLHNQAIYKANQLTGANIPYHSK